jgi:adenosine deaminase
MTAVIERDLALLPKGHLHVHFEAAMRRATLVELADDAGIDLPAFPERGGFDEFAGIFLGMIRVLSLPGAIRRVTAEAAQDADADGVVYLELGISPQFYVSVFGSAAAALDEFLAAALDATEATGVEVRLMVTFDRTEPVEGALELARLAAAARDRGVVSVGLANDEVGHPAAPFAPAFAIARDAGLLIAPHAGELLGPESVAEALDVIGADRVQHGVRAVEDPQLLARLVAANVSLDVCPTSNAFLGLVADVADHPLPALLAAGVRCSINADDPTIFDSSVLDEYRIAREVLGLSDAALAECARTSIVSSSASPRVRLDALVGIDRWLSTDAAQNPIPEDSE